MKYLGNTFLTQQTAANIRVALYNFICFSIYSSANVHAVSCILSLADLCLVLTHKLMPLQHFLFFWPN